MKTQTKKSLPFLLAAMLLASATPTLPAQTQSRFSWLSGAFKNQWGKMALVALVAAAYSWWSLSNAKKPAKSPVLPSDGPNGTKNLTDAIYRNKPMAINYWLSKATPEDLNNRSYFCGSSRHSDYPTPLEAAIEQSNLEITNKLLKKGARANSLFIKPILFDILRKHPELLETLLKHGLDPNFECHTPVFPSMLTPEGSLIKFLKANGIKCVEILLDHEASGLTKKEETELSRAELEIWTKVKKEARNKNACRLAGLPDTSIKSARTFNPNIQSLIAEFAGVKSAINYSVTSKTMYDAMKKAEAAKARQAIA